MVRWTKIGSATSRSLLALAAGAAAASCAGPPPRAPAATGAGAWSYEVALDERAETLAITGALAPTASTELTVNEGAEPFVGGVEFSAAGAPWEGVEPRDGSWTIPACARGCRIRYRFDLRAAAEALDADDTATSLHGVLEAPPATWLLRPLETRDEVVTWHVTAPPGVAFVTGVHGVPGAADTYRVAARELHLTPYTVMGRLRTRAVDVGGGAHVTMAVAAGKLAPTDDMLAAWVARAGRAVTAFYGAFPIDGTMIAVIPTRGRSVGFGRTMAAGGASIMVNVGRDTGAAALDADWVMVHEMIHLAFPSMPRERVWIEEGLATYLEPIIRARAGMIKEEEAWRGFRDMMPNGLPAPGDRGLDRTHTWGRVYWGGALFCLLADLDIRQRTKNRRTLEDALRGVLEAGGNDAVRWPLERALDAGDHAIGVPALRELHARMGSEPFPVDLDALFGDLGVTLVGGRAVLDDSAPLAAIRRSMTAPFAASPAAAAAR